MIFYVYKTTNLINGKIYIGARITKSLPDKYLGSGKILTRAVKKYGKENFTKEILQIFMTKKEMYVYEAELVTTNFIKRQDVYNRRTGGNGGWNSHDPAIRAANKRGGITLQKRWKDPVYREKYLKSYKIARAKAIAERGFYSLGYAGKKPSEKSNIKRSSIMKIKAKGEKNSQFGTYWIYNSKNKLNKKIKKEDLYLWENLGWVKGRKIKGE